MARRIQVANVSRRCPQILVALAENRENRMSLTVAGLLAPALTESNVEQLLSDCAGMSRREVEEYLVALRPKPVFMPSIRKTPSRPASASVLKTPPVQARPTPRVAPSILEPATPVTFNFRFAAERRFKDKFERLAEVLGVREPSSTYGRDHGAGSGHRARQEGFEEKAGAAAGTDVEGHRQFETRILPGQGSCQIALHPLIRSRARSRAGQVSMRVPWPRRDSLSLTDRASDRAPAALRPLSKPRREVSAALLPSAQPFERREGVWGCVHPRED